MGVALQSSFQKNLRKQQKMQHLLLLLYAINIQPNVQELKWMSRDRWIPSKKSSGAFLAFHHSSNSHKSERCHASLKALALSYLKMAISSPTITSLQMQKRSL